MAYTYKYPRPAVTADCIVITKEADPRVLLIQRGNPPFKGGWAFPGGFMNMDETTEQCAIWELEEETGLQLSKIRQIGSYSKVDRDPRGRTVTVAYLAIFDEPIAVTGQDDAAKAEWWPLSDLPHLAFDHYDIMQDAIRVYNDIMKLDSEDSEVMPLTRVRFVYYDENGNEYHVAERDMNMVPNVGEEIFLDTGDFNIDLDGWTVKSRVCDLGKNCWLLAIEHRLDDDSGIWKFKEKTLHDQFKEQKERMHEISNQIREQCSRVQELCSSYTKKNK